MRLLSKGGLYNLKKQEYGFAIPQVLILGVGIAIGVSGLMAASILGLTGSRINKQELIAKASSESGITTIRSLLNDGSENGFFHYLWLVNNESGRTVENPSQKYWPDDEWCEGSVNCNGRQKAPMCTPNQEISWDEILSNFKVLLDTPSNSIGKNYTNDFNQTFNLISTKYTGTEQYGVNSILIEGLASSVQSNLPTASNKLRVNVQINSETSEAGFGFLSIGENQLDEEDSLFLGNLNVIAATDSEDLVPKGSIIWRRNLENNNECGTFTEKARGLDSNLPKIGNGGIWVQPLALPKQPRLSNVEDLGILICTPTIIQKENSKCKIESEGISEKVYRIHSLYAKGPGSEFQISTTDNSKVILEIMGDVDISNGGNFCHKDGLSECGTGKAQNLTILFKQKTNLKGNKIACNHLDNISGGVSLKNKVDFSKYKYPIDNDKLPGSSFLIDNTGVTSINKFGAFIFGPKLTFLSVRPESQWVQVTNSQSGTNNGMIISSRGSYGLIRNTLGKSFDDRMVNIILTPDSNLIPYLGQKDISQQNENNNVEIIGIGYKSGSLPQGATLNPIADKVLLIYNRSTQSYFLRTFDVDDINPDGQTSSEYSYPRSFAKMHSKDIKTHVNLPTDLKNPEAKLWLDAFNIKVQKLTLSNSRNFSGAAWVKNFCLDNNGEKTWEFSKTFINNLREWHGKEFNWGVKYYRGRSIILWDTLRDFIS